MKFFQLLKILLFGPKVTIDADEIRNIPEDISLEEVGEELKKTIKNLYGGRSLRIRAVDAGSSNAEEIEFTALNNAYYDIDRFGLTFVASPRHADMLFVSGPVTRNLETALKTTYEAAPNPCIVVAIGDGAIDGGIWKDSYAVVGGVEKVIPVHVKIAGDPPSPIQILRGVLQALNQKNF
ncbi:MAG: NADH ubiquinone oxidoreductase, 20 kDa subunit [Candidatus Moranbacteria bacterium GW2011_GWD2_36_12]|nr:MAG: NADH ubiquinone oxidoreductase, 20 kDa subunit [Candidatus Moranbacteria bacterium GW2011_GWD2_36_12]KKQ06870.1 MAG: NADH ubiquinone oxidoreductase, 20 kDa subunit [Candidatus Moranbacteria bacterium GW2011_GWE2_36_40]